MAFVAPPPYRRPDRTVSQLALAFGGGFMIKRLRFSPLPVVSHVQKAVWSRLTVTGALIGGLAVCGCGGEESTGPATGGEQQPPSIERNPMCMPPVTPAPGGAVAGTPMLGGGEDTWPVFFPFGWTHGNGTRIDLGADGIDDFIVVMGLDQKQTSRGGALYTFTNDGSGQYQRDSLDLPFEPLDVLQKPTLFDANGDGLEDIYWPALGPDFEPFLGARNVFLLQQPDGSLVNAAATNLIPYEKRATVKSEAGDIDCDGDLDLIEVNGVTRQPNREPGANLLVNDGMGTFTIENSRLPSDLVLGANPTFGQHIAVDFCDVNGGRSQ